MPGKFFGEYLIEKGAITHDMLVEAARIQQAIDRPLLAMAISRGFLTDEQLAELDREIQDSDGGHITIDMHGQKGIAVKPRKGPRQGMTDSGLFLAEALVRGRYVKMVKLRHMLAAYEKEELSEDRQFWVHQHIRENILPNVPNPDVVSVFLQITIDSFREYTKQSIRVGAFQIDMDMRRTADFVFTQKIFGDRKLYFALVLPESITLAIGSHIAGKLCGVADEFVLDAVAEYLNIVVGNALRRLSATGCKLSAKAPDITTRNMMRTLMSCSSSLAVEMKTEIDVFHIMFFFEDRKDHPTLAWQDTEDVT